MFACQNFLNKSCSKLYKEQNLFHGHLMKMITTYSKSAYKADLGAVLALSPGATSLLDRFWKLHISSSGRFGLCSSWQTCRTRLVLQEYQQHHLKIHHGLEVNQRQSGTVTQASRFLNGRCPHRRGRPAQHQAAICRPYAVMDATTPRTHPALVHSLPPSLSRDSDGESAIPIAVESFASSSRPRHCASPLLRASLCPPRAPPSSPPLGWPRSPRGEPYFARLLSSGSRSSRPRFRRTSPLLHPCLLSSL